MHQLENGYTKIANSIIEALFKVSIPTNSMRVLLWVIRNSYGYHKKHTNPASLHEIARVTGLGLGAAHCARAWLLKSEILRKTEKEEYLLVKNHITGVQPTEQGVQPTESPQGGSAHRTKGVQPTEQGVQPTERKIQPTESPIRYLKENLKKSLYKEIRERKVFTPPKIEEVRSYCLERKNQVNPDKWFSHYEANGWLVGKNRMKNWKASIRYWEHSDFSEQKKMGTGCAPIPGKYDGIGEKA